MSIPVKIVSLYRSIAGWGWSEVHYKNSAAATPNLREILITYINTVIAARVELLGMDCAFVGARASYPRAGAIASYGQRQFVPSPLVNQPGSGHQESLAVVFVDSTSTKSRIMHMRGYWDSVVVDETYQPTRPEAQGWQDRFSLYKSTLIDGQYGWMSKDPATSSAADVTNYVTDASQIVTFALAAPGLATAPIGGIVPITFSKINGSDSVLNRTIMCQVLTPTSLVTIKPIACGPFVSKGKASYRATTFVRYADTGSISAGTRRMGKPLNRPRGRSRAKPLM